MALPVALIALWGALIVILGVYVAIILAPIRRNINILKEAERQRVRKRTAQRLVSLQAEKRKLRGS